MRSDPATFASILDQYLEETVRLEGHALADERCDRRVPAFVHAAAIAALGAASVAALLFATLGTLGLLVRW